VDQFSAVIAAVYYRFVSNEYKPVTSLGIAYSIVSFIGLWNLPESPQWQLDRG
jgi:hypothetical protein